MNTTADTRFAHVVATVDPTEHSGQILYINPSNIQSNLSPLGGLDRGDIALVLRNSDGVEIRRIIPEVRYDACSSPDDPHIGLIQQDVELPEGLASLELVQGEEVLDVFEATPPEEAPALADGMTLEAPLAGAGHRRSGFSGLVEAQAGVTYLIEARPDNQGPWSTLFIGRKTPDFEIDKNQFPGARKLSVRVVQNAGVTRRVIDEREIELE